MEPLTLREGDPARQVELPRAVADALVRAEVAHVSPTERPGWWDVSAGTRVGAVTVADWQVLVQPKIPVSRLLFFMGYARNPSWWRDDRVRLDADADLPEALTDAFVRLTRRALEQGLLKGYRTVEESSSLLRGRIREADQIRRHWGRAIPLEVRYDEFSVDVAENQVLLAAVEALLRMPRADDRHRASLQRLRLMLADVTMPLRGDRLPRWTPSRLNLRYQPALELAEMILTGHSFEQRIGPLQVTGYLFNMATIFEDFVTVALREAMKPYGGRSHLQYRAHLDEAETVPVRPDFVWSQRGVPRIVIDAKYKAEKSSGFPQPDLYQLLAYCTVLGLPVGHLVYAKGNEEEREHVVQHVGTRIIAHTLDLAAAPAELLESVQVLARTCVAEASDGVSRLGRGMLSVHPWRPVEGGKPS